MNKSQFNTLKRIVNNKLAEFYRFRTKKAEELAKEDFAKIVESNADLITDYIRARKEYISLSTKLKKANIEFHAYGTDRDTPRPVYGWNSKAKERYLAKLAKTRDVVQEKLLKLELGSLDGTAMGVYEEIMAILDKEL